jgi:hypothetical protein
MFLCVLHVGWPYSLAVAADENKGGGKTETGNKGGGKTDTGKKDTTNKENTPKEQLNKPAEVDKTVHEWDNLQQQNTEGGKGEGGKNEPTPKEPGKPKKPRRIPNIKIKGDGRQWNPSSIV